MTERFTYPPDVRETLRLTTQRRRWFWILFLSPFWVLGLWSPLAGSDPGGWIGPVVAIGASGMALLIEHLHRGFARQTCALADQTLEYDGRRLRQLAPNGAIIGEMDLNAEYVVTYSHSVFGNAVYEVRPKWRWGSGPCIRFSSCITRGDYLVREILRRDEWPPGSS